MGLQQLGRRCGAHLAGYDALQVFLYGYLVDGHHLVGLYYQAQRSAEGLLLVALPVESVADDDVAQREGRLAAVARGGLWCEAQLAVLLSAPQQAAVAQLHGLLAADALALGLVGAVQAEVDALGADDAHRYRGLRLQRVVGGRRLGQLGAQRVHVGGADATLGQDGRGPRAVQPVEVLAAGGDDESRHVECAGADEQLAVAAGVIAVGAVLATGEDDAEVAVTLAPGHDVHHRLLQVGLGAGQLFHGAVHHGEKALAGLAALAAQGQCRTGVAVDAGQQGVVAALH